MHFTLLKLKNVSFGVKQLTERQIGVKEQLF